MGSSRARLSCLCQPAMCQVGGQSRSLLGLSVPVIIASPAVFPGMVNIWFSAGTWKARQAVPHAGGTEVRHQGSTVKPCGTECTYVPSCSELSHHHPEWGLQRSAQNLCSGLCCLSFLSSCKDSACPYSNTETSDFGASSGKNIRIGSEG